MHSTYFGSYLGLYYNAKAEYYKSRYKYLIKFMKGFNSFNNLINKNQITLKRFEHTVKVFVLFFAVSFVLSITCVLLKYIPSKDGSHYPLDRNIMLIGYLFTLS